MKPTEPNPKRPAALARCLAALLAVSATATAEIVTLQTSLIDLDEDEGVSKFNSSK